MLFVLGAAEKQFATDAVFHFQYQYPSTSVVSALVWAKTTLVSFTLPVSYWRVYTQWDPVRINVTTELVDICISIIYITRVFNSHVLTKSVVGWEYTVMISMFINLLIKNFTVHTILNVQT